MIQAVFYVNQCSPPYLNVDMLFLWSGSKDQISPIMILAAIQLIKIAIMNTSVFLFWNADCIMQDPAKRCKISTVMDILVEPPGKHN